MGYTEYKTDDDKYKLLNETIDGVCNNMKVRLDYSVSPSTRKFFWSVNFSKFETLMKAAKEARETDEKISTAVEALQYWDFAVKLRNELLSDYVRLLRDILAKLRDYSQRNDVWRKDDGTCVLYNITQERLLIPHEHITTTPHEPKEPEPVDVTTLLLQLHELSERDI